MSRADEPRGVCRRSVLAAGGAAAAAVCAAGCGATTYDPGYPVGGGTGATGAGPADPHGPAAAPNPASSPALGPAAAVPVGGGQLYRTRKVVVTQPEPGRYKAFSAVCTHANCLVAGVVDGAIFCPCHNSRFSITDGSVLEGPATRPLPGYPVTDDDGQLRLGSPGSAG